MSWITLHEIPYAHSVHGDLQPMAVARGSLDAHRPACGDEAIERLHAAAEPLRGARIVHVSPAGAGGRVPELLKSMLPLAADLELEIEWQVLFGDRELQAVAHSLHDGLQGAETAIDDAAFEAYLEGCARATRALAAATCWYCTTRPRSASRPLWPVRRCGTATWTPRSPTGRRSSAPSR